MFVLSTYLVELLAQITTGQHIFTFTFLVVAIYFSCMPISWFKWAELLPTQCRKLEISLTFKETNTILSCCWYNGNGGIRNHNSSVKKCMNLGMSLQNHRKFMYYIQRESHIISFFFFFPVTAGEVWMFPSCYSSRCNFSFYFFLPFLVSCIFYTRAFSSNVDNETNVLHNYEFSFFIYYLYIWTYFTTTSSLPPLPLAHLQKKKILAFTKTNMKTLNKVWEMNIASKGIYTFNLMKSTPVLNTNMRHVHF